MAWPRATYQNFSITEIFTFTALLFKSTVRCTEVYVKNVWRVFSIVDPRLWSEVSYEIRCSNSVKMFKRKLKTHSFKFAFMSFTALPLMGRMMLLTFLKFFVD